VHRQGAGVRRRPLPVDDPELEIGIDLVEPRPERRDDGIVREKRRPEIGHRAAQVALGVGQDAQAHRLTESSAK